MSAALERVIAEQQATIDRMEATIESQSKTLTTMWKQHEDLFEAAAKLADTAMPKAEDEAQAKAYHALRHSLRMQLLNTGYCMGCYSFVCECDHDYN
jgi:uncharacterized coiled-coil protein SlyX